MVMVEREGLWGGWRGRGYGEGGREGYGEGGREGYGEWGGRAMVSGEGAMARRGW